MIALDGCSWVGASRYFVLVASFEQVLTAAFLQGLSVCHLGSKDRVRLQNQSPSREWEEGSLGIRQTPRFKFCSTSHYLGDLGLCSKSLASLSVTLQDH